MMVFLLWARSCRPCGGDGLVIWFYMIVKMMVMVIYICIMPTQSLYSIIYMIVMTMVMVTLMIMTAVLILQGFER